jgi:Tfp pilus assembly protein FimT
MAIVAILASIAVVGLPSIMSSQSVSKAASDLSEVLDDARSYAMANHTYVYVGFEEVNAGAPTSAIPQTQASATAGGRVAVAVVASLDGTYNYTSTALTASDLTPITQLRFFNGLHIADFSGIATSASMNGRVAINSAYSLGAYSTGGSTALFTWPVGSTGNAAQYTFYNNQVIRFDQEGAASLISSTSYTPTLTWIELGLQLTYGNAVPALPTSLTTGELVALQIDGVTGANHVLRP